MAVAKWRDAKRFNGAGQVTVPEMSSEEATAIAAMRNVLYKQARAGNLQALAQAEAARDEAENAADQAELKAEQIKAELLNDISELKAALALVEGENGALKTQLEALTKECDQARDKTQLLQAAVGKQEGIAQAATAQIATLAKERDQARGETKEAEARAHKLELALTKGT